MFLGYQLLMNVLPALDPRYVVNCPIGVPKPTFHCERNSAVFVN